MRQRLKAWAAKGREPSALVGTIPPGSAPETGVRQLTLGGTHINWNQFGGNPARGIEYNWADIKRKGRPRQGEPSPPAIDPNQGSLL